MYMPYYLMKEVKYERKVGQEFKPQRKKFIVRIN